MHGERTEGGVDVHQAKIGAESSNSFHFNEPRCLSMIHRAKTYVEVQRTVTLGNIPPDYAEQRNLHFSIAFSDFVLPMWVLVTINRRPVFD